MKRLLEWKTRASGGQRDLPVNFYLALAICCVFGIAAITRVSAAQGSALRGSAWQGLSANSPVVSEADRTKIAEGEYEIYEEANGGAVGPAGTEVYDFHESWTLWRGGTGNYEVEGERTFESPRDMKHANRFLIQLSRDLTPLRMTEFAKLAWRRDSEPTVCEFLSKEIHCFSGAPTTTQAINLYIPMKSPYGFLWPISPFSLSGLTRQGERDLDHPTMIQLLSVEEPSPNNPIYPVVRSGRLQYVGVEEVAIANQNWRAYKFTLKVPSYPTFWVWTSTEGLLLAVKTEHADPHWPAEGMKLMRFHKWADFSDHERP